MPTLPSHLSPVPKPSREPTRRAARSAPLVLVVDDDALSALLAAEYLGDKGFDARVASTGGEALRLAHELRPDLILMDVVLPDVDGLAATRALRADPAPEIARVPIIALTARAMLGDRERGMAAGANAYLTKPVRLLELLATVRAQLAAGRPAHAR